MPQPGLKPDRRRRNLLTVRHTVNEGSFRQRSNHEKKPYKTNGCRLEARPMFSAV